MTGIEKKIKILLRTFLLYNFALPPILPEKNEKLDVYVTFIPMWIHPDFWWQIFKTLQEISYAFSETSFKFI